MTEKSCRFALHSPTVEYFSFAGSPHCLATLFCDSINNVNCKTMHFLTLDGRPNKSIDNRREI
jgi:hypothetical protein